eukprot:1115387-Prymnesium_polylepis.2
MWSEGRAVGWDGEPLRLPCALHLFSAGKRESCAEGAWLDHQSVALEMDPRDRGGCCGPPGRKAAIAWTPLQRDASRWVGKGLPPEVEDMMVNGITIDPLGDGMGRAPFLGRRVSVPLGRLGALLSRNS